MSLVAVHRLHEGRSGSGNFDRSRDLTERYQVIVNDPNDGATFVRGVVALLHPFQSFHPDDAGCRVVGYREEPGADWQQWFVTVEFSSKVDFPLGIGASGAGGGGGGGSAPGVQDPNPLQRGPTLKFTTESIESKLTLDFTSPFGRPIENSVGEPFAEGIVYEKKIQVMTYSVNKERYIPENYDLFAENPTTNDSIFLNYFPANTVNYFHHEAESLEESGVQYWRITTQFYLKFAGFNPVRIKNQGFREYAYNIADAIGAKTVVVSGSDVTVTVYRNYREDVSNEGLTNRQPRNLSATGFFLNPTDSPVYLDFKGYLPMNYGIFE